MTRRDWEPTRLDLHPADPPPAEPVPEPVVQEDVVEAHARRVRVVRGVCTVIKLVCGLFAVVLAVHIVLVLAEANPNNGFASLVDSWSAGVSLGLRGLFTPGDQKLQVLLNDGAAALGWLLFAGVLTYAIRRFALPAPRPAVRYHRRIR